jgi:hypothetical protein
MSAHIFKWLLLAWLWAPAAFGQFGLFAVDGSAERPVPAVYDLGGLGPAETGAARFRIRNVSTSSATLSGLTVTGSGFKLASGLTLPAVLAPQAAVEFAVEFQAVDLGAYSAGLVSDGISVLLTAAVVPRLTYQDGAQTLGEGPVNFGAIERGSSLMRRIMVANLTPLPLIVPGIFVSGDDFALSGTAPNGTEVPAQQTVGFDIVFRPSVLGTRGGTLRIGDRAYALSGTGVDPSLPKPHLAVDFAKPLSAQQGAVSVTFDAPAKTGGTGAITLDFRPAVAGAKDSAIAFASGGRTAAFTVSAGDTQAHFGDRVSVAIQTGTTAGALVLTVELGGVTDQQIVAIDPAAVTITSALAVRTGGAIEIAVAGFDNTRSAGALTFTFFDVAGSTVSPGALRVDAAAVFAGYFATSDGGVFSLKAAFPVTGDASRITSVEVQLANSAGATKTSRIAF